LSTVSAAEIEARFDPIVLNSNRIYPGGWSDNLRGYVGLHFDGLKHFIESASNEGLGAVLQWT
jgi:hypothetical protein